MVTHKRDTALEIAICTTCLFTHANGRDEQLTDAEHAAHLEAMGRMIGRADLTLGHLGCQHCLDASEAGDDSPCNEGSFSHYACGGCGSTEAGTRYPATVWFGIEDPMEPDDFA